MPEPTEPNVPFRWDLVTPDRLGSMVAEPVDLDPVFLDALVDCSAKLLARTAGGDLVFVGRSLDSIFDLLGGALDGCDPAPRTARLPFSFARGWKVSGTRFRKRPLSGGERDQARVVLAGLDLTPHLLARRHRPVSFVDIVSTGGTFGDLFAVLRDWIEDEHEQWDVIRTKLRFIGVTRRTHTSPNTFRWQQHAAWTPQLPGRSVVNVSLSAPAWHYLADYQVKLTRSFRPEQWLGEADGPGRSERTRLALAEAVALVSYGRSAAGRRALIRAIDGEPALTEPWLRSLVQQLNPR
jgi:hypothetical protein